MLERGKLASENDLDDASESP